MVGKEGVPLESVLCESTCSYLHMLLDMLSIAMEEERYEDAEKLKREVKMALLPSQQSQVIMEKQQLESMKLQLSLAVCPTGNKLLRAAGKSFSEVMNSCKSVISSDDLVFVPTTPQKYRKKAPPEEIKEVPEDDDDGDFLGKCMQRVHLLLAGNPPDVFAAGRIVHEMIAHAGSDDYSEGEVGLELSDACSQKVVKYARMEIRNVCNGRARGVLWRDDLLRIIALCELSAELDGEEDGDFVSDFLQARLEDLAVSCYRRALKGQAPEIQTSQDLLRNINSMKKEDIDVPGALAGLEEILFFVLDFVELFMKNAQNVNQTLLTSLVARGASVSSRICYSLFISLLLGLSLTGILHTCKILNPKEDGAGGDQIDDKAQVKAELNKAFKVIETFEEKMVEMLGSESEHQSSMVMIVADIELKVVRSSFEVFDRLEAEESS